MRRELAAEAGVPPYVIFHEAVLSAMASERPATRNALADIPGVRGKKRAAWGDACLNVIRPYQEYSHDTQKSSEERKKKKHSKSHATKTQKNDNRKGQQKKQND